MTVKSNDRRSNCPIAISLDLLGDKWTLLVVRDMVFAGKRHFNEMQASPEGIASNILADRLKRLEAAGIIEKRTDPDNRRRRVIYRLTRDKGMDLIPILLDLAYWGASHDETAMPPAMKQRIEQDRDGMIAGLRAALAVD